MEPVLIWVYFVDQYLIVISFIVLSMETLVAFLFVCFFRHDISCSPLSPNVAYFPISALLNSPCVLAGGRATIVLEKFCSHESTPRSTSASFCLALFA